MESEDFGADAEHGTHAGGIGVACKSLDFHPVVGKFLVRLCAAAEAVAGREVARDFRICFLRHRGPEVYAALHQLESQRVVAGDAVAVVGYRSQ